MKPNRVNKILRGFIENQLLWLVRVAILLTPFLLHSQTLGPCTIETIAGGGTEPAGDGGPAVEAELFVPNDAQVAPDGSLYISDTFHHVIRRVDSSGIIDTVVGSGVDGFSGDGGPALGAALRFPASMAFGPDGSLFFHDSGNRRVRRVFPDGTITTVAGNGETGFSGDGVPATQAGIGSGGIDVDSAGNLYIVSSNQRRVHKVTPDGVISTVAGNGPPSPNLGRFSGDGGPAVEAELNNPSDVAVDREGRIYIADRGNRVIRRVLRDGTIESFVSSGSSVRVEVDSEGNVYWFDGRFGGIRVQASSGEIETVVDGRASFFSVADDGTVHVIGGEIQRLEPSGELITVAGIGRTISLGDGGPALAAHLRGPTGVAVGPDGEIYVAEGSLRRVRVITPDGRIEAFAGTGELGFAGDGVPAIATGLGFPQDVAVDSAGNVYIADTSGRIFQVDTTGVISTFAGGGTGGDGSLATEAELLTPDEVAVDSKGNVYVLDRMLGFGKWIRRINTDGIIRTLSTRLPDGSRVDQASGMAVDSEDHLVVSTGAEARSAMWRISPEEEFSPVEGANGFVNAARAIAVDPAGNMYYSGFGVNLVRRLTPDGLLGTIAGRASADRRGEAGFAGDGGPAGNSLLSAATGLALDAQGNLLIADRDNQRVRRINDVAACEVVPRPQIAIPVLFNGATFGGFSGVPGLIFSVFGRRLGSERLVGARLDESGRLATELSGTRVLIGGIPAPMIFSSANQVSGVVPYGVEIATRRDENGQPIFNGRFTTVEVEYQGIRSETTGSVIDEADPGLFTLDSSGRGQAAALNEDGTINGSSNPAAPGSIVVLFGTGEGRTDPPGVDGQITTGVLPKPLLPVEVRFQGKSADILFAGGAPGLVAGVLQVNARVPADLAENDATSVELIVGDWRPRQQVTVAIGN